MRGASRAALLSVGTLLAGCAINPAPAGTPLAAPERELTAGLVQRAIREGASGEEVVSALGSPNIVTRSADGQMVWVYDRVASERAESVFAGSIAAAVMGGGANVAGAAAGSASQKETRERTSQKTLTVVIRFDGEEHVRSFSVHSTRF